MIVTVRRAARRAHPWLAWLFVVALLVEVFLAGLAVFGPSAASDLHGGPGSAVVGLLALAILLAAVAGGLERTAVRLSLLLLVLYVVQTALPQERDTFPTLAALHPLNALALFALGVRIARTGPDHDAPDGGTD